MSGQLVPIPPVEPQIQTMSHLLHLVLTFLTAGIWLLVWIPLSAGINRANEKERQRYAQERAEYQLALTASRSNSSGSGDS